MKLLLLVLVVAGVGLVSLPWWLGAALRPALRARGVTFERYERTDYAHFRLHGVHYLGAGFDFTARQVKSLTPAAWLWRRLRGAEPVLLVEGWRVVRSPSPDSVAKKPASGLPSLPSALQQLGLRLAYWLPQARLTTGELRGFGPPVTITSAVWQKSTLTIEGLHVADQVISLGLTPATDGTVVLTAHTATNDARLRLVWSGAEIKGEAMLWDQVLQLAARFPSAGWLPTEASAVAENWRLPAARLKLGAPYAEVRGEGRLLWRDHTFELSASAKAGPAADDKTKAPPFEASAKAQGNLRELTLTAFHIDAPFATARLSAPVTFSLDRPLAAESARLTVQADLSKMPWLEARGQVQGTVTVAGDSAAARQDFDLKFNDIAVQDLILREAEARGTLTWPLLELTALKIRLDEISSLEARGRVDWQTRELAGVALAAKLGPAWFSRWLPAGTTWTMAEVATTLEGPLAAPRHQGSLKLSGGQRPPLHPLALEASWQGTGAKADLTARATTEKAALELAGTLTPHRLHLAKFHFVSGGLAGWQLAAPVQVVWSPVWQVDGLELASADNRLTLKGRGGPEGFFELAAANLPSTALADWVALAGPGWTLQALQATGRIADQVLVFDTALTAQIEMSPQPAMVSLVAHGDTDGIVLKEFSVIESGRVLTQATGRLPLALVMAPTAHLRFDETAPLELSASTEPDSPLWATLSASTGLQLTGPTAKISLKGTFRQPVGELQAQVARLSATAGRFDFPVPDLDDLVVGLQFGRERVTLTDFSAKVDGQAVSASGQTPMDDGRWRQLWRDPARFDWSQAAAKVEIPDADLAVLARRFPTMVAAQGRLRARMELTPGENFSGELHLTDAATRPLAPFGALQNINADLLLANHRITIGTLTAKLGGEPVTLDGSVTLMSGAAPRLALGLKGKNLPLVRNTGLLLRSDLDLRADTDAAGVTRLSGALDIRDCLVLANVNLRTLLPTGRRGVTRQPPYFAVETEPFRHWPLAVAVRAPAVVRVRTSVYNGTASASFQLGGTLGEPRAVGALTVDQGRVLFPFATFKVLQGAVRLREADPFHAVVSLNALSQRRDYQLRLEMTGALPAPNVTITSIPAMDAADALLMVMTGQVPATDTTTATSGGQRLALLGAYLGRGLFQDLGLGGEDRLEIAAGERISRSGRETYEFEYKLGERWSLLGEYDEYDAYNAGLKWRVFTKEGAPLERK
ncbi:MAG: translocation/assembly module TamB domain-containing protein [Lacunisphaera sp.]|nr:translocation/assembly module TamB domain-containing protein [Lacunisphaera sp.]